MAKIVKDFKPCKKRGPVPRYPWGEWLDGQQWQLTRGEDFKSELVVMQDTIRKKAKKLGILVSVWYGDDDNSLVVQSRGKGKPKKRKKAKAKK